jgi:hypothetical protein
MKLTGQVIKTQKDKIPQHEEDLNGLPQVLQEQVKLEGYLVKESKLFYIRRRRWFVLTDQYLCSFKTKGVYTRPTEFMSLCDCSSVRSAYKETGVDNSIYVVSAERTFFLIAESSAAQQMWMTSILNSCLPALTCNGKHCHLALFVIDENTRETSGEIDAAVSCLDLSEPKKDAAVQCKVVEEKQDIDKEHCEILPLLAIAIF